MKSRALKQRLRQVGTRNVSRLRKPCVPSKYGYITCISRYYTILYKQLFIMEFWCNPVSCKMLGVHELTQSRHKCSGHWGALIVSGGRCPSIPCSSAALWPSCWMLHHGTNGPTTVCTKSNMTIKHAYKIPQKAMFSLKWAGAVGHRRSFGDSLHHPLYLDRLGGFP